MRLDDFEGDCWIDDRIIGAAFQTTYRPSLFGKRLPAIQVCDPAGRYTFIVRDTLGNRRTLDEWFQDCAHMARRPSP